MILRILCCAVLQFCIIGYVFGVMPTITRLNVQCDRTGMKVNVEFDNAFNGIVFSKGHYSDPSCRYVAPNASSNTVEFSIPVDSCGTNSLDIESEDGEPARKGFENIVVFQDDPVYLEQFDQVRMIVCRYNVDDDFDMKDKRVIFKPIVIDMLDVVSIPIQDERGEQSRVDCWMEISKGRFPQTTEIDGAVKVGSPLTLAIFVKDPRKRTDVRIKDCYAYDDPKVAESNGPALLQLTDFDGCPTKPKLIEVWRRTNDTGSTGATIIAFTTVTAFKFPDRPDLQLTCNIELCRNRCASRCASEMPEPVSVGAWSKAPVEDGGSGGATVTQQTATTEEEEKEEEGEEKEGKETEEKSEGKEDKEEEMKEEDKEEEKETEEKDEEKEEGEEKATGRSADGGSGAEGEAKDDDDDEGDSESSSEKPAAEEKEKSESGSGESAAGSGETKAEEKEEADDAEEKSSSADGEEDESENEKRDAESKSDDADESENSISAEKKKSGGGEKQSSAKKVDSAADDEDEDEDEEDSSSSGEQSSSTTTTTEAPTTTTTTAAPTTTTTATKSRSSLIRSKARKAGKSSMTTTTTSTTTTKAPKSASQVAKSGEVDNTISESRPSKSKTSKSSSKGSLEMAASTNTNHLSTTTLRPLKELMDFSQKLKSKASKFASSKPEKKEKAQLKKVVKTTTAPLTTTTTTTSTTTTTTTPAPTTTTSKSTQRKKFTRPSAKVHTKAPKATTTTTTTTTPKPKNSRRARNPAAESHPNEFPDLHNLLNHQAQSTSTVTEAYGSAVSESQQSPAVMVFYDDHNGALLRRGSPPVPAALHHRRRTSSTNGDSNATTPRYTARAVTPVPLNDSSLVFRRGSFRGGEESSRNAPAADFRSYYAAYSHFQPQRIRTLRRSVRSVDPVFYDENSNGKSKQGSTFILSARVISGLEVV